MYEVRLVTPSATPASSCNHSRMVFTLCPSARAALISGHKARIWPAFVAGFSRRRAAKRLRAPAIQFGEISVCCKDRTEPLNTKGLAEGFGNAGMQIFLGLDGVRVSPRQFAATYGILRQTASERGKRNSLRQTATHCDIRGIPHGFKTATELGSGT